MKTITLKENLVNIMKGLVEQLNKASEAYYSGHAEIMSDKEWNDKFDELTALEKETGIILPDSPTHNVSTAVQTQAADSKLIKVQHEYAALSLAKTKSIDDLVKWADGKVINMSWKLDGLTLVATYDNGKLSKLVTRGDGIIGNLVTHLASAIEGVELTIPCKDHIVIRGEAVISYTDFNDYIERTGASYENPRNLAAGSFNISSRELQENLERIEERHVRWIPFTPVYLGNKDKELTSWYNRMDYLHQLGFNTVESVYIENPDKENITKIINYHTKVVEATGKKKTMDIPVDGLVICYDDWEYSKTGSVTGHHATRAGYAFKWEDEAVKTHLTNIEWSVGKKFITPVAVFDPVRIEGTTVTRASLCNVSECKRLGIGEGSEIDVIKANKIIPKIVKSTPGILTIPTSCPICKAPTVVIKDNDAEMLVCTSHNCYGKKLAKFKTFVSKHGTNVDGMSEATIQFLMKRGWLTEYKDIFLLKNYKDKWMAYDRFGKKSVEGLLGAVEKSREITLDRFLYSLSIPFVGRSTARDLSEFVNGNWDKFIQTVDNNISLFTQIDGISDAVINSLKEYFIDNQETRNQIIGLIPEYIFQTEVKSSNNKDLSGKIFVITGSLNNYSNRDELKRIIEQAGGKVAGSVSAKTTALINNDITSTSGKNKKAKELGIQIIAEDDFIKSYLN